MVEEGRVKGVRPEEDLILSALPNLCSERVLRSLFVTPQLTMIQLYIAAER